MRTTLIIEDGLLAKAASLTGIAEKTKLIHMGLEALIHRESARRLSALGGSMSDFEVPLRKSASDEFLMAPSFKVAEKTVPYGVS